MKKLVKLLTLALCMAFLIGYVPSTKAPVFTPSSLVTSNITPSSHTSSTQPTVR